MEKDIYERDEKRERCIVYMRRRSINKRLFREGKDRTKPGGKQRREK